MPDLAREIARHFASCAHVIWILAPGDERRIEELVGQAAERIGKQIGREMPVLRWNPAQGGLDNEHWPQGRTSLDPLWSAIQAVVQGASTGLYLMFDLGQLANDPTKLTVRRVLTDVCRYNQLNQEEKPKAIVTICADPPHRDIREYVSVVEMDYPSAEELEELVARPAIEQSAAEHGIAPAAAVDPALFAKALAGLTVAEAEKVSGLALTGLKPDDAQLLDFVADQKGLALRGVDGLTYVPHAQLPDVDQFAGFDNLVAWLDERRWAYDPAARAFGVPFPRGAVLLGLPGTGKSQVSKAGAKILGLDLVELNFAALFGQFLGQSEQRLRRALQAVEAMGNVYLVIDEIDKAITASGDTDGGAAKRMLGDLLKWMADRRGDENRTFVAATANRTAGLPPELLRAGRFDKVFFTDLPTAAAATEILRIHLATRGVDPERYGKGALDKLVKANANRTGAELEQAVKDAIVAAWARSRRSSEDYAGPTIADIETALRKIVPITQVFAADLERIREDCKNNGAEPVTSGKIVPAKAGRRIWSSGAKGNPELN